MHDPKTSLRISARRTVAALLGVLVTLTIGAMPVAAYDPDIFELEPTPAPRPQTVAPTFTPPTLRPTPPAPAPPPSPEPLDPEAHGYDVSWPQCNDDLPETFGFAIVGVNRGRTFSENDCLASQLKWAGQHTDVYLNTANPGPDLSRFWPVGESGPVDCERDDDDSRECAYLYGWNAAADGYARVLAAHVELDWVDADAERVAGDGTWWLDVETANSWRGDKALNIAALQGAVDFLESVDVAEVGFYSTPWLWWLVTRGTDDFAGYPAWHAGAGHRDGAEMRCEGHAFTGGELRMVQWVEDGLDHDIRCDAAP
jgi:hypothetical protein